ncbi:MAG: bifunctional UDP-N-acetylglucosamine diphosphorylase/glucosamine-1-phosphate N-acetyltransferase GlmU [Armatimonas sp.]
MASSSAAVVLAAGKSTRMKSKIPKMLHPVCGLPILFHILDALAHSGVEKRIVVIGHEGERVMEAVQKRYHDSIEFVWQREQKGTGHAVRMAEEALKGHEGTTLVLPGDAPLLSAETLKKLLEGHVGGVTLLSAMLDDPAAYGRIVRDSAGGVEAIVEFKDATEEQRAICEINAAVYAFDTPDLLSALSDITPANAQGEYYLTDAIGIFRKRSLPVNAVISEDPDVTLGVNTRVELAELNEKLRRKILRQHMLNGVTIQDPVTTYIDATVTIGQDTTILPGTHLWGATEIGSDCRLGPSVVIEDSVVGDGCKIGPFAQVRPGTRLGKNVKIGNFVETKNAVLGDNVSAGHLTYLGDASVGARTNIGAGTITCNYDGWKKHRTVIGADCFIGSHSTLVAPIRVEDDAATAAGSVITKEVPSGALAFGRARQECKEGWWAQRKARKESDK